MWHKDLQFLKDSKTRSQILLKIPLSFGAKSTEKSNPNLNSGHLQTLKINQLLKFRWKDNCFSSAIMLKIQLSSKHNVVTLPRQQNTKITPRTGDCFNVLSGKLFNMLLLAGQMVWGFGPGLDYLEQAVGSASHGTAVPKHSWKPV